MKRFATLLLILSMFACSPIVERPEPSVDFSHGDLEVSDDHRMLVHADGTLFFYLGDTCWELFHRTTREEAERYLENRRQKRFTVIQAVALAELDGLDTPNSYGDRPLVDNDPAKPDTTAGSTIANDEAYDYWDHVDWIINKAAEKGIYIALLPTWGDKVLKRWGVGPVVFDSTNAVTYGKWIANRYKNKTNIIWMLGGDRAPEWEEEDYKPIWRAMANAIKSVDKRHLMGYHSWGGTSSSQWFHDDSWLDFNTWQSGHSHRDDPNWQKIITDYRRSPIKPVFDGESNYEDHPVNFKPGDAGWFSAWDVRKAAYRSLFAGAFGYTYGCNDIWQLWLPGREKTAAARTPWPVAMDLPGATQMTHVRNLMESRPMLERIPDPSLIVSENPDDSTHVLATRAIDGSYAMIYLPQGGKVEVDLNKLSGSLITAWWYMPVNGVAEKIGQLKEKNYTTFITPYQGPENDWVLVLDNGEKSFPVPGERKH